VANKDKIARLNIDSLATLPGDQGDVLCFQIKAIDTIILFTGLRSPGEKQQLFSVRQKVRITVRYISTFS
jgi:hypothetical protein